MGLTLVWTSSPATSKIRKDTTFLRWLLKAKNVAWEEVQLAGVMENSTLTVSCSQSFVLCSTLHVRDSARRSRPSMERQPSPPHLSGCFIL